MDYDRTTIPETYSRARDHGPEVLRQWMDVVAAHVDTTRVHRVLDLGCGTGRFSEGLATRLRSAVIGMDPSRKMLAQARRHPGLFQVFHVCGCAEALPLRKESVDLIFLSMVFHHFTDPGVAARECSRVLGKDGRVFLRTGSREQISAYPYVPFFPRSRALLEEHLPALDSQRGVFEAASFKTVRSGIVTQRIAADFSAYADKVSLRADSILTRLDDEEFNAGVEALRRQNPAGAVIEPIDFVVFEKR